MDRLSKIRAGWRLATSGQSLKSRVSLILFLHGVYAKLAKEMQDKAKQDGELQVLKALQSLLEEIDKNAK